MAKGKTKNKSSARYKAEGRQEKNKKRNIEKDAMNKLKAAEKKKRRGG